MYPPSHVGKKMAKSELFTKEQKLEAGMEYYQWQSYVETARRLTYRWGRDVSKQVLKFWDDNSDDFREGKKKGAVVTDRKLTAKYAKIAEESAEFVLEQLKDPAVRKGLRLKDVAWVGYWAHDKRQVAEGKATAIRGTDQKFSERLKEIEEQLAESNAKRGAEGALGTNFNNVTRFKAKDYAKS